MNGERIFNRYFHLLLHNNTIFYLFITNYIYIFVDNFNTYYND